MKKIIAVIVAGIFIGSLAAAHAKLPPAPPKSDADKAAEADKAAAAKAKDAESLGKAQDRAVANYKKGKGIAMDGAPKTAPATTKKK